MAVTRYLNSKEITLEELKSIEVMNPRVLKILGRVQQRIRSMQDSPVSISDKNYRKDSISR